MAISALHPIVPASITKGETEEKAPWIVRKMLQSIPARVVGSALETVRATATTVVYLSPWGDSNPVLLPNVRYRDLLVQTIVVATGGAAAIAEPVFDLVADEIGTAVGDIIAELVVEAGVKATTHARTLRRTAAIADDTAQAFEMAVDEAVDCVIPPDSERLVTTAVKTLLITLKYKHTMANAALGYFFSSSHEQESLFSTVKDFISIEKGWFSPYLFASHRRPDIPRAVQPDFVFCQGPFLAGDYRIAQTLLEQSAMRIAMCQGPDPEVTPAAAALRRMVVVVVGLKPYRGGLWTSSERPGESVLHYTLLNGCPAIVLPLLHGKPLVAWHALTLEQLQKLEGGIAGERFRAVADSLFAYVSWCVDWERVIPDSQLESGESIDNDMQSKRERAVRRAVETLLAGAVQSDCPEVRSKVDGDRAGIAFFRMP